MPLVAAQPVTQVFTGPQGFEIAYPKFTAIKVNETFKVHVHVFNESNGKSMVNVSCLLHIYNSSGSHLVQNWMSIDTNFVDFNYSYSYPQIGHYTNIIQCNNSVQGGFVSYDILVTPGGVNGGVSDVALWVFFVLAVIFLVCAAYFPPQFKWFFFMLFFLFLVIGVNIVAIALQNDASSQNIRNFYDSMGAAFYYLLWVVVGLTIVFYIWSILASIATRQKIRQAEAVGRPVDWNKF